MGNVPFGDAFYFYRPISHKKMKNSERRNNIFVHYIYRILLIRFEQKVLKAQTVFTFFVLT